MGTASQEGCELAVNYNLYMPFIAVAVAIAAALGGGATLAAENALPGDALWSYKVNVNENIRSSFAGSTEAKAEAHINAIEQRMQETEKLATEGQLTAETQASIETNLDLHTTAVTRYIADLEAAGDVEAAADIAARYQATIAARAAALAQAEVNAPEDSEAALSPILVKIRTTLDHASEMSANASAQAAAKTSANTTIDTSVDADAGVQIGL